MAQTRVVKLTDLLVNTENYRFDVVASQKEAIDKMVENQNDNLFNLAEHILNYGLNPNDKVQVVASNHDPSRYIVLEGNRRTVTLKLLQNPDLIDGFASLKKKFRKLHDDHKDHLATSIECVVYNDPKEADTWIGIKHGYGKSGTGTDGWDPLQKQRFGEKTEGKTTTALQVIKFIKNSSFVAQNLKDAVEKISTTNLDRLISDPDVRQFLGIEFNNGVIQSNISEEEVVRGLAHMVKDILDPKFTVKKIYDKVDRTNYIKSFPIKHTPNTSKKAQKPWIFNSPATPSLPPHTSGPQPKPTPKSRTKLIPKNCVIPITNPKVNDIYNELKEIDVKHKNAVAVLFRVFIELSVDTYIEDNQLAQTPSAAKSGLNLQQKINIVANHLDNTKKADAAICKGIKNSIKDANSILGLDTWHAYIHNNKFSPIPTNLMITWDNVQEFMVILWTNIK